MTVGYGPQYSMWWTDCVLDGWCLRTHQGLLPGFPPSSIDWPNSVTWDEVGFLPLPPLVLATDENGGSLLPTPMANQSGKTPESHLLAKNNADGSNRSMITDLQILLRDCLLPTPTSTDAKSPARFGSVGQAYSPKNGLGLTDWARATTELLPTPQASNRYRKGDGLMLDDVLSLSSPECQTGPNEITGLLLENMQLF